MKYTVRCGCYKALGRKTFDPYNCEHLSEITLKQGDTIELDAGDDVAILRVSEVGARRGICKKCWAYTNIISRYCAAVCTPSRRVVHINENILEDL